MSETLIREYYACFNERRFQDATTLFREDAVLENIPFGKKHSGGDGYVRFAQEWNVAFPDATLVVDRVDRRGDTLFDVHLVGAGTHRGILDVGMFRFQPNGAQATLRLRELLEIKDGTIVSSSLSFELNDLIAQLSTVDYSELAARLERIRQLTDELARAQGNSVLQRDVADRLGPQLDAARKALRPHYKR